MKLKMYVVVIQKINTYNIKNDTFYFKYCCLIFIKITIILTICTNALR